MKVTLFFGADTLVVSPRIGNTLVGFHHRVARRLAGICTRQDTAGRWVYPPLDAEMTSVSLEEVETYVLRYQNTTAQYILNYPILELCLEAE